VRGSFERGKKHGVWRSYLRERLIAETHYHLGEKHGRDVQFDPDGTAVFDLYMHLGVLHGPCNITREAGLFLMGRRVGTWRIFGSERRVIEVREYDTGVLLSVDGRRLPPPPSTLSMGTKTIDRAACDRDNRSVVVAPCRELFEAHQRCAVTLHPDDCRATATRHYLDSPGNKP
jgi:hypothetical protein